MLLPLQSLLKFVSWLESSLYQNVRILDKRFPASIIVPFKFKWRPSLRKCHTEMLLWKMTFLSSCFKMLYFFKYVIRFLLICSNNRWWYDNAFVIRGKFSYGFRDIHQFLPHKIFCFYGLSLVPIWMMILSGSFLR